MLIVYHFIEYSKNGTSSVRRNDEEEGEGIKDGKKKKEGLRRPKKWSEDGKRREVLWKKKKSRVLLEI
jgi:hypothetical protein